MRIYRAVLKQSCGAAEYEIHVAFDITSAVDLYRGIARQIVFRTEALVASMLVQIGERRGKQCVLMPYQPAVLNEYPASVGIQGDRLADLFAVAGCVCDRQISESDVIAVGTMALRAQAITLPLMGFTVMTNMMLQSMGKGVKASIASSSRNGIFFVPLILILPRLFGLFGVEITQACADVLSLLLAIPLAVSELRKL